MSGNDRFEKFIYEDEFGDTCVQEDVLGSLDLSIEFWQTVVHEIKQARPNKFYQGMQVTATLHVAKQLSRIADALERMNAPVSSKREETTK